MKKIAFIHVEEKRFYLQYFGKFLQIANAGKGKNRPQFGSKEKEGKGIKGRPLIGKQLFLSYIMRIEVCLHQ